MPTTSVVTLKVTGMTCGGCVLGVRKVLTRLDGVTHADVSYEQGPPWCTSIRPALGVRR